MDIFEPFSLSGLGLPNRLVRAATYEKRADEDGYVTDALVEYYRALALGGAGLIITGGALVHHRGRYLRQTLAAHSDLCMRGLTELAGAVHAEGGLIALELDHGGRQCTPLMLGGEEPLGPSAIMNQATEITPRAMNDSEIWEAVDAFASAAFRAQASGMDALELRAGHGHLIGSFLSGFSNRREDYWGGDAQRRTHFLEEVTRAVRKSVGAEFPVIVKLSAEEHIEGGINSIEAVLHARAAEEAGADAIELSGGTRESEPSMMPDGRTEGYYRAAGELLKKSVSVPVILTGGFRTKAAMEAAIDDGAGDLIGLCRALIRDPGLPLAMKERGTDSDCDACSGCTKFSRRKQVECQSRRGRP